MHSSGPQAEKCGVVKRVCSVYSEWLGIFLKNTTFILLLLRVFLWETYHLKIVYLVRWIELLLRACWAPHVALGPGISARTVCAGMQLALTGAYGLSLGQTGIFIKGSTVYETE